MPNNLSTILAGRRSIGSMSIRLLWPFLKLVPLDQQADLVARMRSWLGVNEQELHDPDTRVPMQLAVELLESALGKLHLRSLGLLAAQQVKTEDIGIAEYLARSNATLGEALQSCNRYLRLLGDGIHHSLDVRGERTYARFWFDGNLTMGAAAYEFAAAVRLEIARRVTGLPGLAPLEMHFMHSQPRDLSQHCQMFNCLLRFNMPVTQMVLSSELLALPLQSPAPVLRRILERQAEAMLADLPHNDNLVLRVRYMLNAEADLSEIQASHIARRLGMSVRSLARRLGEEGTSYRALLDERRMQAAVRDLAQTLRPINDIAQQLGFSTSQSFHRAFRRWTGETAGSFRCRSRRRDMTMH